ncbi:MAG: hypothetical protein FWG68_09310 [Defluviitaleaceae bacterium]|nr:hypothetical protein [Defluviitaleaceae bacterium]
MAKNNPNKEMLEYVYNPEGAPDDFQNVAISIEPFGEEAKILVTLINSVEMTPKDVEGVLEYLEKTMLKRQRLSLADDCVIRIDLNGTTHDITIDADKKTVKISA